MGYSQEKWGTIREELGKVRQQWGAVRKEWGALRGVGTVQKEWGAVREEWGPTHLLSGCTWYPHLRDMTWSRWKVPMCPAQGLGVHKGLDLGVHKAPVAG